MAPSSSSRYPSTKLLITDPLPKSIRTPESSSSATSPPPPEKRTRVLPNLSDCHCCGGRINYTNPKDRLQPLRSLWRIVLLCRKCRASLRSGQKCTYCFQETGNSGDLLTCPVCLRKIHKNCVWDYRNCTPWRCMGMGLNGFRVCVDCWVPELLKNSVSGYGRSRNKGGSTDKGETEDLSENGFPDARCGLGKKIKRVVMSKENVLTVNGDMNAVGFRGKSVVNTSTSRWKGLSYNRSRLRKTFCEDQELETVANAVKSERMNRYVENDPTSSCGGLSFGIIPYKREKKRKIWLLNNENEEPENLLSDDPRSRCLMKSGTDISEDSICVNTDRRNGERFGPQLLTYRRTRFKKKVSGMLGVSRDSSSCDSHIVAFRSDNSPPDDTNLRTGSPDKSYIKVILPSESPCTERDRYQRKYFKRIKARCSVDNEGTVLPKPNGTCIQETNLYSLKYTKRVKSCKSDSNSEAEPHSDAFLNNLRSPLLD